MKGMKLKVTQSCPTLYDPVDYSVHEILQAKILEPFPSPGDLPNTGIEPWSPTLQADSLPAELHKASPKVLEWIIYPFSRGSSWCRDQTRVSCIAGGFFTSGATREVQGANCNNAIVISNKCLLMDWGQTFTEKFQFPTLRISSNHGIRGWESNFTPSASAAAPPGVPHLLCPQAPTSSSKACATWQKTLLNMIFLNLKRNHLDTPPEHSS